MQAKPKKYPKGRAPNPEFELNERGSGLTNIQKDLLQIAQMHSEKNPYRITNGDERRTAFALRERGLIIAIRTADDTYSIWEKEPKDAK